MTNATMTKSTLLIDRVSFEAILMTVTDTRLGYEDHGIFTMHIDLQAGTTCVTAGNYALDKPRNDRTAAEPHRAGRAYGMEFIIQVMHVFGVSHWEEIKGKSVYALMYPGRGYVEGLANAKAPEERHFEFARIQDKVVPDGNS